MDLKRRIKLLENRTGTAKENCGCSRIIKVGRGETIHPCPDCGKKPSSIVLPTLEDYESVTGIPRGAKIYAGFDPDLV
jgi:hypothetical protein